VIDPSILLIGFGLGLRHAIDPDHVVVVSALARDEASAWRSVRVAALWGAGHTASLLGVGLLIVLAGVRLPALFERVAELLVAALLIGLGLWTLARSRSNAPASPARHRTSGSAARSFAVGVVHGLAGSAAIVLLATTSLASPWISAAYLGLFGLGTIMGMVALTLAMAWPLHWTTRRGGRIERSVDVIAGALSLALGVAMLYTAARADATSGPTRSGNASPSAEVGTGDGRR